MTMISLLIAVAELRTRRRLEAEAPERLKTAHVAVPVADVSGHRGDGGRDRRHGVVHSVRSQLIPSFISLAVVLVAACLRYRQGGARATGRGTQPSRT